MNIVYQSNNGKIIHGDNIEVMKTIEENSIDSCISDFPYAIEFMGKNWDSAKHWNKGEGKHGTFEGTGYSGKKRPAFYLNTNEDKLIFYDWCFERAKELYRIMKPGGYVCIFGHPKTNHRMKCAFEDVGFKIVEEIDWIYFSGMPKNQDIGKLFDKANDKEFAEKYKNFKTAGLKPAHEPITIFQKPLDGTYIENIRKYGCGAMNIDACRVPINPEVDDPRLGGKGIWSTSKAAKNIYEGGYKGERVSSSELGRFPPNVIFDEYTKDILDEQTGIKTNTRHMSYKRSNKGFIDNIPSQPEKGWFVQETGGGSRMFPIIKYCPKVSPKERLLPNGERNPHVTLKPKELIKWLIKLVTPKDGTTIDITAGSCTHAIAVEELNRDEGYNLKYIDIELMNTETEPYCDVGKMRVESIVKNMS